MDKDTHFGSGEKLNGTGEVLFSTEAVYNGTLKENRRTGKGVYHKGTERYEGDWKNDKRNGYGVQMMEDGTLIKGDWKENIPHGNGTILYEQGDKGYYSGDLKKGKKHGFGTEVSRNRVLSTVYEGDFE